MKEDSLVDINKTDKCPCCSGKSYGECCRKFVVGKSLPKIPLELMRSRYTAYVLKDINYIEKTASGKALETMDKQATVRDRFDCCEWTKLEIIDVSEVTSNSITGIVEFKAHYSQNGITACILHERSKFQRIDSKWFYISGVQKNTHIEKQENTDYL